MSLLCFFFLFFFFFVPFLLAGLAEYVLQDQQEMQVEDAFGKIYVEKINFLHFLHIQCSG